MTPEAQAREVIEQLLQIVEAVTHKPLRFPAGFIKPNGEIEPVHERLASIVAAALAERDRESERLKDENLGLEGAYRSCALEQGEQRAEILALRAQRDALVEAVRVIYFSAIWHPDRSVQDEQGMWTRLRDAAGFEPGASTTALAAERGEK